MQSISHATLRTVILLIMLISLGIQGTARAKEMNERRFLEIFQTIVPIYVNAGRLLGASYADS